jgi:hypothetical protein
MAHQVCSLTVHNHNPKEGFWPRIASATIQGPGVCVLFGVPVFRRIKRKSHIYAASFNFITAYISTLIAALLWKLPGKWLASNEWLQQLGVVPAATHCASE